MNCYKQLIETEDSYLFNTEFLSYLVSLGFRSKFQVENKLLRGQVFSFHVESIFYSIEILEKGILLEAKSFFFSKKSLEKLVGEFGQKIISCYSTESRPRITLLKELTFKDFCILSSHFFLPVVLLVSLIFCGLCCFYYGALRGYLENMAEMKSLKSPYLEAKFIGKMVEDFYDGFSVWKASFLMAIFGSGFGLGLFFVMQFVLYRLLPYFSNLFISFHIIFSLALVNWLWPLNGSHWMLYILPFVLIFSLPLFIFFTRSMPVYIKESK